MFSIWPFCNKKGLHYQELNSTKKALIDEINFNPTLTPNKIFPLSKTKTFKLSMNSNLKILLDCSDQQRLEQTMTRYFEMDVFISNEIRVEVCNVYSKSSTRHDYIKDV